MVQIKIRVVNQLTKEVVIDNTENPLQVQDYSFETMSNNAKCFAEFFKDCSINFFASNGDFILRPAYNMLQDEENLPWDEYISKWYPSITSLKDNQDDLVQIERYEEEDWNRRDSICH
jgi:hypothetical protein